MQKMLLQFDVKKFLQTFYCKMITHIKLDSRFYFIQGNSIWLSKKVSSQPAFELVVDFFCKTRVNKGRSTVCFSKHDLNVTTSYVAFHTDFWHSLLYWF